MNRKDADDCLENSKKLQNINKEAVGLSNNVSVFVNSNLSPYMNKLAYLCRVLKRKNLIEKVTTFKGVIKIARKIGPSSERSVWNVIGHITDLKNLFPDLDTIVQADSS